MTNPSPTNTDDRHRNADDQRRSADRLGDLIATVIKHDLRPDECTIYPRDVTDEELVTKWITAEEGSYVELEAME